MLSSTDWKRSLQNSGGSHKYHTPLEEPSSKKMAAMRSRYGVPDAFEWDDSTGLNSHEEPPGGRCRKSYRAEQIRRWPGL
jgi:hypothetical protein